MSPDGFHRFRTIDNLSDKSVCSIHLHSTPGVALCTCCVLAVKLSLHAAPPLAGEARARDHRPDDRRPGIGGLAKRLRGDAIVASR